MKNQVYFFALIIFYAFSVTLAAEPSVWNGNADTQWYNDNDISFTITTAEQLAGFAKLVNDGNNFKSKTITLNADIILNDTTGWELWNENTKNLNLWTPIGIGGVKYITENEYIFPKFEGIFEGNWHKISGIYVNAIDGYQGLFGEANTIKNIGVLASWIKGSGYVGGIAGTGNVYGSYYRGKVSGTNRVGGVVGAGAVDSCYFMGSVKGNNYVGGIVGGNGSVANSYSMGVVNGDSSNIGGIVGYTEKTVTNSYSSTIVNGSSNVGGIAGHNNLGKILNSYYIKNVMGNTRVGGIAGRNDGTISNCYSTDTIKGSSNVGGIVGANYYSGSILNSYSTGDIIGSISVGGIAGSSGFMNSGSLINNYSVGNISGDNRVGGIAGTIYDGFATNNYSVSSVNGKSQIGGIAGTIDGSAAIENNYFSGIIEGIDSVGGIAGNNYKGKVFNNYWNETLNSAMEGVPYGAIGEEDIGNLIGIIDTKMKSIQFIETLNAFVDSANAVQTKIIYLSWYLDANNINQGYPVFNKPTDTPTIIQKSISLPNISLLINAKHFQVQGITKAEKVKLINIKGSILLNKVVQPNELVSIAHLPQGIYFINVGGKTFKFSQISTF